MMSSKEEIRQSIESLLRSQHLGVLATQGSEYPYCTLVAYAISEDLREIIFATIRDARKYRNIKKTPRVSLLIDSRVNQVNDFKDAEALTAVGSAGEISDEMKSGYLRGYLEKHPSLEEFVKAPNCALMKIQVAKYILVQHFQNVTEYDVP